MCWFLLIIFHACWIIVCLLVFLKHISCQSGSSRKLLSFSGKSRSKNQGFYYLYLEAISIKNSKSQSNAEDLQDSNSNARASELADLFSFSPRDLEFIVKFSEEYGSDIFQQIVQSICPSIYGHELVKGILLWTLLPPNCRNSFLPFPILVLFIF